MPVELDLEEEVTLEDLKRLASERRDRNSLAIEEVVGRNPARRPTLLEPKSSTPKPRG
jgi:hypothetical protein